MNEIANILSALIAVQAVKLTGLVTRWLAYWETNRVGTARHGLRVDDGFATERSVWARIVLPIGTGTIRARDRDA